MFREAAEIEPSAKAYTYWGMALRDSQRSEEAKAVFAKAIEADPNLANSYNQLGLLYMDQGQWDDAAEQFAKAIKLAPQWSNYHYNLGLAYRGSGKLERAIDSFKKAITIYPSHAWSEAQLGSTLAERECQERGAVAEETARSVDQKLKRAVELKPNDRIVLETAGQTYWLLGWSAQAIDAERRAAAAGDRSQGGLDAEIKRLDRPASEFDSVLSRTPTPWCGAIQCSSTCAGCDKAQPRQRRGAPTQSDRGATLDRCGLSIGCRQLS